MRGRACLLGFTLVVLAALLLLPANQVAADPDPTLAAYYPFSGSAADESGNGNHGVVFGATPTTDRSGAPNSAMSFDGVDDYIQVPDNGDGVDISDDFTIALWMRSTTAAWFALNKHTSGVNDDGSWFLAQFPADELGFQASPFPGGADPGANTSAPIPTGTWAFVALTYIDSTNDWAFFVDGAPDAAGSHDFDVQNTPLDLLIGRADPPGSFFAGDLDDIRIFKRALSGAEIAALYDTTPPDPPTLTDTDPDSPANENQPKVKGTAEAGSTVKLYTTPDCSDATPAATGSAADFGFPGLMVTVADNSTTTFHATATDAAGNASDCSTGEITYVEESGYARPKSASPLRISLVPAYFPCAAPNLVHGPPALGGGPADPSCNPPIQSSGYLTVGTPDANGAAANSVGSVRIGVVVGVPGPPADSDIAIAVDVSDVRCKTTTPPSPCGNPNAEAGRDYTGQLGLRSAIRLTDRFNAVAPEGGADSATTVDFTGEGIVEVACAPTDSTAVGSTCKVSTTLNALVAGAVLDGKRAMWQFERIEMTDGGSDGIVDMGPNDLFAVQGVFVP